MTGTTISHYQIEHELGRGGMGVVYKARDTRLNRTVAIKVLPAHALASEDDRARFYREAQAAAALSHANIATVYEIDESLVIPTDGGTSPGQAAGSGEPQPFIAMEFVEGESLADRIAKGPLPLKEAISITRQIADGLHAAHTKNIVHRDIKSGNVMLTADGQAKILDFGLAKTAASTRLTNLGSTLGTIAYMSPEQARGEEVDRRTDIWSLGAVLYEMITGRMPFPGDYEQAVVYGILNEEPEPPTALRTGVPMELERIVAKCLSKDARHRYQHVDEVGVDLGAVAPTSASHPRSGNVASTFSVAEERVSAKSRSDKWMTIVGGAMLLLTGALVGILLTRPSDLDKISTPIVTSINLDEGQRFDFTTNSVAITHDGTAIAYSAEDPATGVSHIYYRPFDKTSAQQIPASEGGVVPFFSPQGSRLGYVASDVIHGFDLETETTEEIGNYFGIADGIYWGDDGVIYHETETSIVAVSPFLTGQAIEEFRVATNKRMFQYLEETHSIMFSTWNWTQNTGNVLTYSLGMGRVDTLMANATAARIAAGHLWFIRDDALRAVRLESNGLAGVRESILIQPDIRGTYRGHYLYDVSETGTVVYVPGEDEMTLPVWVGRDATEERLGEVGMEPARLFHWPALSRDAMNLAITKRTAVDWTMWMYDIRRDRESQFLFDRSGIDGDVPIWTPDENEIYYQTILQDTFVTRRKRADGSRSHKDLPVQLNFELGGFSPDGRLIIQGGGSLSIFSIEDSTNKVFLAEDGAYLSSPSFSPDGQWVAYVSNETGRSEVYLTDYPGGQVKQRISQNGGQEPLWSPGGGEFFYREGQWMVAVKYATEPTFSTSSPDYLFEGYLKLPFTWTNYVYDEGNDRFLMFKRIGGAPFQKINIIQNALARSDL